MEQKRKEQHENYLKCLHLYFTGGESKKKLQTYKTPLKLSSYAPKKSTVVSVCAECPLTMASQLEGCAELIKVLKNGGAHLDFRTRDGITALHKAVRTKNHTALIVSNTHTLVLPTMGGNMGFSYILEREIRGTRVCPDMSHRVAQR